MVSYILLEVKGHFLLILTIGSGSGSTPHATPPLIVNWTDVYTTVVGSGVVMSCEAVGNPAPVVYWQHRAHVLNSGRSIVRLVLEGVTVHTAGEYTCLASTVYQMYGVVELTALLIVVEVPTPTHPFLISTGIVQNLDSSPTHPYLISTGIVQYLYS